MIDFIIPSLNLNHAKIEPLIIPQEKLQELKTVLANPKLADTRKSFVMRKLTGSFHSCGQMATQIAKYRMYGAAVIEKYCNECLCLARSELGTNTYEHAFTESK